RPGEVNYQGIDLSRYLSTNASSHRGVSLDIENYCTLRLLFNQSQLLYRRPECDKLGKYCSLSRLLFLGCSVS
ncbi:hypothetical protein, partial [Serratia marcescens]|uniref:hypothetical protein n=1 Tax=Serratia marcescens TaxID=615 RepID=UPI001CAA8630